MPPLFNRLLKNAQLLCCAHHSSLQRTKKYASFLMISRALHLAIFEQPAKKYFFNDLLDHTKKQDFFFCLVIYKNLLY